MGTFTDLCKRYYLCNWDELKGMIITVLALTLIVSFNDKSETFNLLHWLGNFLIWLAIVVVSFIVHQSGHRLLALRIGYRAEYQLWWYGLIIGLIVMLVTRGKVWILIPGGVWVHQLKIQRLGRFRYGPNMLSFGMIALFGPLASVMLAGLVKTPELWLGVSLFGPAFVTKVFLFNMALAAYALIPIPPLAGSRLLFHSRLTFAFVFGCIAGYAVLGFLGVFSYFYALLTGVFVWLLYYVLFEKGAWKF